MNIIIIGQRRVHFFSKLPAQLNPPGPNRSFPSRRENHQHPPPPSIQITNRQLPLPLPPLNLRNQHPPLPIPRFPNQTAAIGEGIIIADARIDALTHSLEAADLAPLDAESLDLAAGIGPTDQDELVTVFTADEDVEELVARRLRVGVVAAPLVGSDADLLGRDGGEGGLVGEWRDGADAPAVFHVVEALGLF